MVFISSLSERLRLLHHRRAQRHRRPAGNRRHAQPAVHFDHLTDWRADWFVHRASGERRAAESLALRRASGAIMRAMKGLTRRQMLYSIPALGGIARWTSPAGAAPMQ